MSTNEPQKLMLYRTKSWPSSFLFIYLKDKIINTCWSCVSKLNFTWLGKRRHLLI